MINHPTAETALQRTNGDRAAARDLIRASILGQAEALALLAGRSLKCQRGQQHAHQPYGCANDGSTCICDCHDKPGGAA